MTQYRGRVFLLMTVLIFVMSTPVLADDGGMPLPPGVDLTDLVGVLQLAQAAGFAATISFLLGKWAWYNEIDDNRIKTAIEIALLAGIPLLAKFLLDAVPSEAWLTIQPYYAVIMTSLLYAFPIAELCHKVLVKPERLIEEYAAEARRSDEARTLEIQARIEEGKAHAVETSKNLGVEIMRRGE